ncbi:MAG: hypothetical protein WAM90_08695 [Rhodanobacter sp.]
MDELAATRRHAERQRPEASATQDQFVDRGKRVSVEFNALRGEVCGRRVGAGQQQERASLVQ